MNLSSHVRGNKCSLTNVPCPVGHDGLIPLLTRMAGNYIVNRQWHGIQYFHRQVGSENLSSQTMQRWQIMEEKHLAAWTSVTNCLEAVALLPQQRDELISHALGRLLTSIPAVGTALIWPCQKGKVPWRI